MNICLLDDVISVPLYVVKIWKLIFCRTLQIWFRMTCTVCFMLRFAIAPSSPQLITIGNAWNWHFWLWLNLMDTFGKADWLILDIWDLEMIVWPCGFLVAQRWLFPEAQRSCFWCLSLDGCLWVTMPSLHPPRITPIYRFWDSSCGSNVNESLLKLYDYRG